MASRRTFDIPSDSDGSTKISVPESSSATFSCRPSEDNLFLYLKRCRTTLQFCLIRSIADKLKPHISTSRDHLPEGLKQTIDTLVCIQPADKGNQLLLRMIALWCVMVKMLVSTPLLICCRRSPGIPAL